MSIQCGSCGQQLSVNNNNSREPCPNCGSIQRVFWEELESKLSISGTAEYSQLYGHTGREVKGAEAEELVAEWASLHSKDDILNHPTANLFRYMVSNIPSIANQNLELFRGSGIKGDEEQPPSITRMGPKPIEMNHSEGRYHNAGQRVLYLSDSEDGVRRELDAWNNSGIPYVIKVNIPINIEFNVGDFSNFPVDHLITAVFSRAEMCKLPERGSDSYAFSQCVAQIVAESFDGMLIPGVRGEPGAHYKNVVLFNHLENWTDWTDVSQPPYRMDPPSHEEIAVAAYFLWKDENYVHGRDLTHWFKAKKNLK